MPASFASFFADATNVAAGATTNGAPPYDPNAAGGGGFSLWMFPVIFALVYFAFIRPQSQAKKKQEELLKAVKTGDRVITTSGIHGVVTNVKDSTVMVKVADNVKLEIEKTHIDKVVRTDATEADKTPAAKS
jgi:preprotein translocase subunit YajC